MRVCELLPRGPCFLGRFLVNNECAHVRLFLNSWSCPHGLLICPTLCAQLPPACLHLDVPQAFGMQIAKTKLITFVLNLPPPFWFFLSVGGATVHYSADQIRHLGASLGSCFSLTQHHQGLTIPPLVLIPVPTTEVSVQGPIISRHHTDS